MQTQELLLAAEVRRIAKELQQAMLERELSALPPAADKAATAQDLLLHNPVHSFTGEALEELKEFAALVNTYSSR